MGLEAGNIGSARRVSAEGMGVVGGDEHPHVGENHHPGVNPPVQNGMVGEIPEQPVLRIRGGGDETIQKSGIEAAMLKFNLSESDVSEDFEDRSAQVNERLDNLREMYIATDGEEPQPEVEKNETQPTKRGFSFFSFGGSRNKTDKSQNLQITLEGLPETMSLNVKKALQEVENYRHVEGGTRPVPLDVYRECFEKHGISMPFEVTPNDHDGIDILMVPLKPGVEAKSVKTEKIYQSVVLGGYDYNISQSGSGPAAVNAFTVEGKHRRAAFTMIFATLGIPEQYRYIPEQDALDI